MSLHIQTTSTAPRKLIFGMQHYFRYATLFPRDKMFNNNKKIRPYFFLLPIFWGQHFWGGPIFSAPNFFLPNFFWPKFFWPTFFFDRFFLPEIFFVSNFFRLKFFSSQIFFRPKFFCFSQFFPPRSKFVQGQSDWALLRHQMFKRPQKNQKKTTSRLTLDEKGY